MKNKLDIGYFLKAQKHLVLFFIYSTGALLTLTYVPHLDAITGPQEYRSVLILCTFVGAFSVVAFILDLICSMETPKMNETAFFFRSIFYICGILAPIYFSFFVMSRNEFGTPAYFVETSKVQTSVADTKGSQYITITQNNIELRTSDKYEYGQKVTYIKGVATRPITKETFVWYSALPKDEKR